MSSCVVCSKGLLMLLSKDINVRLYTMSVCSDMPFSLFELLLKLFLSFRYFSIKVWFSSFITKNKNGIRLFIHFHCFFR